MSSGSTVRASDVKRVGDVVADRLRHLAPVRLEPFEAEVAALLQRLADLDRRAEGLQPRRLPAVSPHAYGDVLSVLVHDLVSAVQPGGADRPAPDGSDDVLAEAVALIVDLRRLLP